MTAVTRPRAHSAFLAGAAALLGGLLAAPLASHAQDAQATGLQDATIALGTAQVHLPSVIVQGSELPPDVLTGIAGSRSLDELARRLQSLTAAIVTIPSIDVSLPGDPEAPKVTCQDVVLHDLVSGRAGGLSVASCVVVADQTAQARSVAEVTTGAITASDVDLSLFGRLFAGPDATPGSPQPLYGSLIADKVAFGGPGSFVATVGRIEGHGFRANPGLAAWLRQRGSGEQLPAPAEGMLALGSLVLSDVSSTVAGGPNPLNAHLTTLTVADKPRAGVALAGLTLRIGDRTVSVGRLAADGDVLNPGSKAMTGLRERSEGSLALLRGAFDLGSLSLADVAATVPAPRTGGDVALGIDAMASASQRAPDGSLTGLQARLDHLRISRVGATASTPPGAGPPGLESLDVSFDCDLQRDGSDALAINTLTLTAKELGTVAIKGRLNQAGALMSSDPDALRDGLKRAAIAALTIQVTDAGLLDRAFAGSATREGRSPAELRQRYGRALTSAVTQVFGSSPNASLIGGAAAAFVAGGGTLDLTLDAKAGEGVPAGQVLAIGSSGRDILDRFDVSIAKR